MEPLKQIPITFDISKLKPVVSETTFNLHFNDIYKNHVDCFNASFGDIPFHKAGAHLHSLYFENLREYRHKNEPVGKSAQVIEMRYGSFSNFVQTIHDQVHRLQGNGWIFMNHAGYVNIIPNNRIVDNVALVIDFWEHAYMFNYGSDRNKYLSDHLHLINWDVVNQRILSPKKEED